MFLTFAFGFEFSDLVFAAGIVLLVLNGHKLAEIGRRLGGGPGGPKFL